MKRILSLASGFYIWVLPIVSVILLYLIKNTFERAVFIFAVGAHLLMVACALWFSIKSRSRQPDQDSATESRVAAILLIAGAVLTFISATTFSGTKLQAIATHKFEHYWTSGGFLLSTIVSLAGLTFLTWILIRKKNSVLPVVGFMAITMGTITWIIHLAFRLSAMVWAADEAGVTGSALAFYEMSNKWAGSLYVIYMILTYLAFAVYGVTFLQTGLLPVWLAKVNVIFGLAGASLFALGVTAFGMPITIQLMPWLIGIYLIRYPMHQKTG